ncbi:MAG: DNA-processing protein DprA [Actinomycetota bacterium]
MEEGHRCGLLRLGDGGYPPLLAEIGCPPARLFVAGAPLEPAPHVAVVGTRRPSRYGVEVAEWLASGLAEAGIVVVSGMAVGIDAAAHRGALGAGGATVAVLGCGLDVRYPRANADLRRSIESGGTLLSEYPPGTPPLAHHFPLRNRIIAGISLGVVIVEGRANGGAMITARLAAEFGREVFVVPGPVHAPGSGGPHALIREGARLVTSAEDVLYDLGLLHAPSSGRGSPEAAQLTPDERTLLAAIEAEPTLLDRIAQAAGMPASAAAATLSRLEMRGLVSRHPGGRFSLPVAPGPVAPGMRG